MQSFKTMFKKYGKLGIITHLTISGMYFTGLYYGISYSNLDVKKYSVYLYIIYIRPTFL